MRRLITALALALAVGGLLLSGCGGTTSNAAPQQRTVTVFAAASLTEVFTRIGRDFAAATPGTSVRFSFGGSSTLAQQISAGAPADVFAAASPAVMAQVTDATDPVVFARNQLVVAVGKGNPHRLSTLADLVRPGLKVAVCAAQVPCGSAAATALATAGLRLTPVTYEQDVKAALTKVRLGEVDAALVYRTDVRAAAADVDGVEFPESAAAINDYPIAVLRDAPEAVTAQAFVAYVRSGPARTVLSDAGFQTP